eukprot:CAMPEP_0195288742 /NCGR_PEP_ID=MMETSP0707-20130614/5283_1 /TAXON_ID=33640 /ORGANISM="Asterionellopsis glacialis, Strain CCMP134" /LENGTH=665 /DNA_ID=CAMNT_0040348643 /DNA_START=154 /DNA_END=2151 /DNA_ORIENTATION=+
MAESRSRAPEDSPLNKDDHDISDEWVEVSPTGQPYSSYDFEETLDNATNNHDSSSYLQKDGGTFETVVENGSVYTETTGRHTGDDDMNVDAAFLSAQEHTHSHWHRRHRRRQRVRRILAWGNLIILALLIMGAVVIGFIYMTKKNNSKVGNTNNDNNNDNDNEGVNGDSNNNDNDGDHDDNNIFHPNKPPTAAPIQVPLGEVTVGVYYYPWYQNDDFNGRNYMRADLQPPQYPTLGEYDQKDPYVISKHLEMTQRSNINLWVTSWSGPQSATDRLTRDVIMTHPDLGGTQIALFYETYSQIPRDTWNISAVYPDLAYAATTYFDHPNYYRIQGRPVLFVYVSRALHRAGVLEDVIRDMRAACRANGNHHVYIVGDNAYNTAPEAVEFYKPFVLLDAITNYDVYGSMGRPKGYAGYEGVENYRRQQLGWRTAANSQNCGFIPSISPGYNDRSTRLESGHPALSRCIVEGAPVGSLFQEQLLNAFDLRDDNAGGIIMVNSFNEWHEDTQIEPVISYINGTAVEFVTTSQPEIYTQGYNYTAYGNLFMEMVRLATTEAPSLLPSSMPSMAPTNSHEPSASPSLTPSGNPSQSTMPSLVPTATPSMQPTNTVDPSYSPSVTKSDSPSLVPTAVPSATSSAVPTTFPNVSPRSDLEDSDSDGRESSPPTL